MHALADAHAIDAVDVAASLWPSLGALVSGVVDVRRRVAVAQAAQARLLAVDVVADRVGVVCREAQRQGRSVRASEAYLLRERFPSTLGVWERGGIDAGHAWAISRAGGVLRTEADRARFEALVAAPRVRCQRTTISYGSL